MTATSNGKSHNDVSPTIPSSIPKMKNYMIAGAVALSLGYYSLVFALEGSPHLTPAAKHCLSAQEQDQTCTRADLFAFQIVPGLAMVWVAAVGFWTWHVTRRVHSALPDTPEGRLFGYLPESEQLAAASFTFQVWDFFISLTIPEHRGPIMLAHHVLAASVSYFSLEYQYLHYYGIFYLGLSEVSSIFLVMMNLAQHFPPPPASPFHQFVEFVCGPLFVVTFFYYRVVLWWQVNVKLWKDAMYVLQNGIAEKLRPQKSFVLYLFLAMNVPLSVLQLYWFGLIVGESAKVISSLVSALLNQ